MDDADMGVALSVTSLVMALAQDNPEQYKGCYVKAASRLKRILVDGEFAADYLYYKVPCPWMQVKLLRDDEQHDLTKLCKIEQTHFANVFLFMIPAEISIYMIDY